MAAATKYNDSSEKSSKPGRMINSAPTQPVKTPIDRLTPTRSPSSGIAKTVTRIGLRKNME